MESHLEEEEDQEWPEEEEMGATANKQHNITAPGMSEITSVPEFKESCDGLASELEDLQSPLFHHPHHKRAMQMNLAWKMGLTREGFKEVRTACNPQSLLKEESSSNSRLESVRQVKRTVTHLVKCEKDFVSYANVDYSKVSAFRGPRVPPKEVVLCIDVFNPIKQIKDHRILVLASQKLSEFRDKIICLNDYFHITEESENPSPKLGIEPSNTSKSAFIFINNTFYNDMRDPEAEDTSRKIISWAKEGDRMAKSSQLDHFDSVPMGDTTFEMIKFRLGYPYLYCHHGNCEHLLIIRDMRLFNQHDAPLIKHYPRIVYYPKLTTKLCKSCSSEAMWLTCDDEYAPESPCFFCHKCFIKLHYLADGTKACQFRAYKYQIPDIKCTYD